MTWYIRPRQDFSLARFAKICDVMYKWGYYGRIVTITGMKDGRTEVVIRPDRGIESADEILARICKDAGCNFKDFRIVEVDE